MLSDSKIATEGFHDVIVENLAASPTWRSLHISPGDVTSLRRRWPKVVFRTMQWRSKEVERLRRFAHRRPEWAFRHNGPGFCSICQEEIASALDVHMIKFHLELGQLWPCRVEWCTAWKGSVSDCLGHLHDKHGLRGLCPKTCGRRPFVQTSRALQWMPDCSTRPDVAWCTSTASTRTHFLIRRSGGGGGVLPRRLSFVGRAMAIAQLTQLHISIPASGAPPGQVPEEYFPGGTSSRELTSPCRVSFASDITVLCGAPPLDKSPDIILHEDEDDMDTVCATTDARVPIVRPPPGFRQLSWPREESTIPGVDWHSGVGWSVGNGTW